MATEVALDVLNRKIAGMFTPATHRKLANCNIEYIGDLIQCSERELLRNSGFGRVKLEEVRSKLADLGLRLGLDVPAEWNDRIRWEIDADRYHVPGS